MAPLALVDYTYPLAPPNPDREATQRHDVPTAPPVEPQEFSLDLAFISNEGEQEQNFRQVEQHLYQRKYGGWYAKIPDQEHRGTRKLPDSTQQVPDQVRKTDSSRSRSRISSVPKVPQSTFMFLKLPWKTEKLPDRRQLVISRLREDTQVEWPGPKVHSKPSQVNGGIALPQINIASVSAFPASQSLLWQHTRFKSPSIASLRRQVGQCKDYGVAESEYNLFEHLVGRLEQNFELAFAGGRYLQPVTLRYDIQSLGTPTNDQSCVFFSFPYLALLKPEPGPAAKDSPYHYPRSLLQSKYRLHNTKDRDKSQSVSTLELEKLKSFVSASSENRQLDGLLSVGIDTTVVKSKKGLLRRLLSRVILNLSPENVEARLHVPQLWGVLPGSNNLITSSVHDVNSLCGDILQMVDFKKHYRPARSMVRLLFNHGDLVEEAYYPVDHCNSWYGLLNKHLVLEENLAQARVRAKQSTAMTGSGSKSTKERMEFRLQFEGESSTLNAQRWAKILKEHRDQEILTVNIKIIGSKPETSDTLKQPGDQVQGQDASGHNSPFNLQVLGPSSGSSSSTQKPLTAQIPSDKLQKEIDAGDHGAIHDKITFLEWPLQDEFDKKSKLSISLRASIFLDSALHKLSVKKLDTHTWEVFPIAFKSETYCKVTIHPFQSSSLKSWIKERPSDTLTSEVAQLYHLSESLFSYFIPIWLLEKPGNDGLNFIWGCIRELVTLSTTSPTSDVSHCNLTTLIQSIQSLLTPLKDIHAGVLSITSEFVPGANGQTKDQNQLMQGAVLLSTTIDALFRILHLYAVSLGSVKETPSQIKDCTGMIVEILEHTQGQLIREADGNDTNPLGPVLTPEATTIALMDRLVAGVCGPASVKYIRIYELCLEKMAMDVRYEASRALLTKLNGFEEELAIISDVLKQQTNVLLQFRASLDPNSFHNSKLTRRLQFRHESQEIDRILLKIREQIRAVKELRERAKQLALENVQLVETSQDQNSKYLFVFTVVTVLFLPPSFVAGFFGMNLQGINPSPWGVAHFWEIAIPLTAGVILVALVFARTIDDLLAAWSRWWNHKKHELL